MISPLPTSLRQPPPPSRLSSHRKRFCLLALGVLVLGAPFLTSAAHAGGSTAGSTVGDRGSATTGAAVAADEGAEAPETVVERGDLRITFGRVQTGLSPKDLRSPVRKGEVPWVRVAVRITQAEQPTSDWGLASAELPGKTPEARPRWKASRCSTGFTAPGEGYFAFPAPPAAGGQPWKTRMEVARAPRGTVADITRAFAPAEIWTLPGLPIPRRNSYTRLIRRGTPTSRASGAVKLLAVTGPATKPPGGVLVKDPVPSIQFLVDGAEPELRVTLLRATDFSNRLIPSTGDTELRTPEGRVLALGLKPGKRSRIMNLVLAVQQARSLEVTLSPERP